MRSSKGAALSLLLLAVVLGAGNFYETLRRSTIPIAIEGEVHDVELRREKHPGIDDVYLLKLDAETIHVDEEVAGFVDQGDRLRKDAWSSFLVVNGDKHELRVSRDFRGMLLVMPFAILVVSLLLSCRTIGAND